MSIGSKTRDKEVVIDLLGEKVRIRREGTDGDVDAAIARIAELDGQVDAIGLGGVALYLKAAGRTYVMREALRMAEAAKVTPVVDGSGLKDSLEREAVRFLEQQVGEGLRGKRVLMTAAVDRYGLAEALHEAGCQMTLGDLVFGLGVPAPIHSWWVFGAVARTLLPVIVRLPFEMVYPTGEHQTEEPDPKYARYYEEADIIAGDFLYVRKYMPEDMTGKWVITNTTTEEDVVELSRRGVELLVTTTPRLEGRSFGTNLMEATLVAVSGEGRALEPEEYMELLGRLGLGPTMLRLEGRAMPGAASEPSPAPSSP
ncbi:MAG: hypothetical protein Kow0056_07300 [Coriobacteriia bacterium]